MKFSSRSSLAALLSPSSLLLTTALAATNITIYQPNIPFVPTPLPAPGPASNSEAIISQFNLLGRTTVWNLVKKLKFEGDTGEPEGMVNLAEERYILGGGQWTNKTVSYGKNVIINGTDRTPGSGYAHLTVYDGQGMRIADATLTEPGAIEYHIGGIEYDGDRIWATIAQYRPNTTATIVSVDPLTLEDTNLIHYADHLGGIVHDTQKQELSTLNWGARNASVWDLKAKTSCQYPQFSQPKSVARNPFFSYDYQDCKYLGHSKVYFDRGVMMCSGVATYSNNVTVGGLAIVDIETMVPYSEVPLTMVSDLGTPITQNPFDVALVNGKMRLYFLPDQRNSTLYVYEAEQNSPYQY
ncbi:hypothetical protein LTR99_005415 [Exophiala xenobiotica]|uniref:Uncharacterized protein n=1 Tax=Vermiconidia calcicola TaxID=1690605 RepID=A0AAV9Q4P2_9PEZI|nr:hypothetical protein LTR92_004172 [Exophiala xenobiotica]KAK5535824.1 hypothetical protein LTR25_005726 [Vermiconidia calcicola]KAK5548764.1 hypothetical protein LTR23_001253 [Chaetothyriales sp. CCFEE 6169]KAK5303653.1 hypothetical protein LTR99_005415 [Exophiala xenobiotica]KAK5436755.1 hypothetical protein LTR34_002386 [Exophiala xenobiotica]